MAKWKRLSDLALKESNFELCESASLESNDFAGLLLMYSAIGNLEGMGKLAKSAEAGGKTNIAFVAYLLTGNVEACADILVATKRLPEAAFFVRTYLPSRVDEIVSLWKADLSKISESAANALAAPSNHKNLFPDIDIALQVEQMFIAQRDASKESGIPSKDYPTAKDDLELNLIDLIKARTQSQTADCTTEDVPLESSDEVHLEAQRKEEENNAILADADKARKEAEASAIEEKSEETGTADGKAEEKDQTDDFGDDW